MSGQSCPSCGSPAQDMLKIDTGMRLALESSGHKGLPDSVCANCYEELTGQVSRGVKLMAEAKAREQNKVMMWKTRVNLVKKGRQLMSMKAFPEAAVAYEKYLRVLEIVHDLKAGDLSPDIFNRSNRSKELTVITSVYWDLLRIYDTSSTYADRMNRAATKLSLFVPYSSIYPDIIKKAESFQRSAKHPQIVKKFLKTSKKKRGACFIATATFADPNCGELLVLRAFRDLYLRKNFWGRNFIFYYYRWSPFLARKLEHSPTLQACVRIPLKFLIFGLRRLFKNLRHM